MIFLPIFVAFLVLNTSQCSPLHNQEEELHYHKEKLPGVILIPGNGGNQIEAKLDKPETEHFYCFKKSDWYRIWLNYSDMVSYFIKCWVDNARLEYDETTHTTHSPEGVDIRIPGFGTTDTVDYISGSPKFSYFAYVSTTLEKIGYVKNQNLKGAPYDFRKAPNELGEYFKNLKGLVEDMVEETGGPIVLIAHSYGAPLSNYFLNTQTEEWRDNNIASLVTLSGAWGGTTKSVKIYAAGESFHIQHLIDALGVREQQRTTPSLAFLLPDPQLYAGDVVADVEGTEYTMDNIDEFLERMGLLDAVKIRNDTSAIFDKYSTAPKVPLFCIYGFGEDTVEKIQYTDRKNFPDKPTEIYGSGDGTVNGKSLELCKRYGEIQTQKVETYFVPGATHGGILKDESVLFKVADILLSEAASRSANSDSINKQKITFKSSNLNFDEITNLVKIREEIYLEESFLHHSNTSVIRSEALKILQGNIVRN